MGQGGSSMPMPGRSFGDILYPDNPNRRQRAGDLEYDCTTFVKQYEDKKKEFDRLDSVIRIKTMAYLKTHGYQSLEELDAAVKNAANSEALRNWNDLKKSLSRSTGVEEAIFAVSGVASVLGAVGAGGLVLAGVVSGPVGWAILGEATAIAAVLGLIGVLVGAILGAVEREKLQHAIKEIHGHRTEIKLALNRVTLMNEWMDTFIDFFQSDWGNIDAATEHELLDETFNRRLKVDADMWTGQKAIDDLRLLDKARGSWTKEDPPYVLVDGTIDGRAMLALTTDDGVTHSFSIVMPPS